MTNRYLNVAAPLVAQFRRQRPMRAGSLIVTLFGDAIAPRGGVISMSSLIGLAEPFGIGELVVRTAMRRLVHDRWLESQRTGRCSEYRLSNSGRELFAEATRHIYGSPARPWSGAWTIVILDRSGRAGRRATTEALTWAGFGEPAPGVFAHPGTTVPATLRLLHRSDNRNEAMVLTTGSSPAKSHQIMARCGWDLLDLTKGYRRFIELFSPVSDAFGRRHGPTPLAAYLVRTLLIHEYRKVHLRDPLLPVPLLPAGWVGTQAYDLCRTIYGQVALPAEQHLSEHAVTLAGPLPAASRELYARFDGIMGKGRGTEGRRALVLLRNAP
jgi:phenylacetic acid degradation operon negative regulatory protein